MNCSDYKSGEIYKGRAIEGQVPQDILYITKKDGSDLNIVVDNTNPQYLYQYEYIVENNLLVDTTLSRAKKEKHDNLRRYYCNAECWTLTVLSVEHKASITKDIDWLAAKLLGSNAEGVLLFEDATNTVLVKFANIEQRMRLQNLLSTEATLGIFREYVKLINTINSAITLEELDIIDIKARLQNCIERNINIDTL